MNLQSFLLLEHRRSFINPAGAVFPVTEIQSCPGTRGGVHTGARDTVSGPGPYMIQQRAIQ